MTNKAKYIGIIMDGNRRWAKTNNKPISAGHKKGVHVLKNIIIECVSKEIKELSVFAFSSENWNRMPSEIETLLNLLSWFLKSEIATLNDNNIKLSIIGDISCLSKSTIDLIKYAEKFTKNNDGLKLNIAINYGGKNDILYATKKLVSLANKNKLTEHDVSEDLFKSNLYSNSINDIDLIIRTSGELRISNFMLWQIAYSEIYITKTYWPDFCKNEFEKAINSFNGRDRRFGSSSMLTKKVLSYKK